jgi:hypothetical protein
MNLETLLEKMWVDYCALNPAARRIFDLFSGEGETVVNDHIALRTFNHPRLGIESLAQHFKKFGYAEKGEYTFIEKKLFARHYEHPDQNQPKIFISELELEKCSALIQREVAKMAEQVSDSQIQNPLFPMIGRPWKMSYQTYSELAKESEYASWVAAYGFRPNHFTVSINHLKNFQDILKLNEFIKKHNCKLNASGGEVKGTREDYLEQSSTMASEIPVRFDDGSTHSIPGCYYEFAKRYPLSNGKLYQGFVAKSADKIFESTGKS